MSVLYILLPLALLLAGTFAIVFVWAVRSGQFDDLETPSHRVLFDDPAKSSRVEVDEADDEAEPFGCEETA